MSNNNNNNNNNNSKCIANAHLAKQLKQLTEHPVGGFKVEVPNNILEWTVWFLGPKDTYYEGGCYRAVLKFPKDFPYEPPEMLVASSFYHPNVYPDTGKVCMSILHPPTPDEHNPTETLQMRWSPIQTIEKILISFISLLSDPDARDAGAPANVDALATFRKNKPAFVQRCQDNIAKANKELPPGFELPQLDDKPPAAALSRNVSAYDDDTIYSNDSDTDKNNHDDNTSQQDPLVQRWSEEINSVKDILGDTDKSDRDLAELCEKYKGDMERILGEFGI